MGYRDDRLSDEERAEAALRRALARLEEPQALDPPPALVSRTNRRLPAMTPARAAQTARTAALVQVFVRVGVVTLALLVLVAGVLSVFAGDWLARLFGDGSNGFSRTLLTLQLLAKPLWHTIGVVGTLQTVAMVALTAVGVVVWWWLVRQRPGYAMERAP